MPIRRTVGGGDVLEPEPEQLGDLQALIDQIGQGDGQGNPLSALGPVLAQLAAARIGSQQPLPSKRVPGANPLSPGPRV